MKVKVGRPKVEIDPIQSERLKQVIREQNVTQKVFAEKIGISRVFLSETVRGKHRITEATAKKIQDIYPQYPRAWLLGFDSLKPKSEKFWKSVKTTEDWPKQTPNRYLTKIIYPAGDGGYYEAAEILKFDKSGWVGCDHGIVKKWAEIPEDYEEGQ